MRSRLVRGCAPVALACLGGCEPYPGTSGASASSSSSSSSGDAAAVTAREPIAAAALCRRLVGECNDTTVTVDSCVRSFGAVLVTRACAEGLAAATCRDLTTTGSPVLERCFPRCSGALAACNGDGTITTCTAGGTTNVLDCQAACEIDGSRSYSGTCGTSYQGQSSDRPQCWCR
jgi:hypothetical protein